MKRVNKQKLNKSYDQVVAPLKTRVINIFAGSRPVKNFDFEEFSADAKKVRAILDREASIRQQAYQ